MNVYRLVLVGFLAAACSAQSQPPANANSAVTEVVAKATPVSIPGGSAIKTAPAPKLAETQHPTGRRDPFVNPIVKQANSPASNCTTGKRCLMIGQLTLKGIIVSQDGMLAIVENAATRTYFLRVNDPLFDGVVAHISRDSVIFRETVSDSLGRPIGTRDVVKKIVAPAA